MIRFMADTWREAVLRPLAMAAPNSWVYTEITAPDFRFILALALAVIALITIAIHQSDKAERKNVFLLFGLIFLSFVPWMATTGNGRYFMPYLILVGPLCLGLINILTCTRGMKGTITLLVLGLQGFALYQNNPWKPADSWGSVPWLDSTYFSIEIDSKIINPATTYVTVAGQTMSLVAPLFPAESRWVNLSVFNGADISKDSATYGPVTKIFQSATSLKLFQRSAPRAMMPGTDQPNPQAIATFNSYLLPHQLALKEPTDCQLFPSESLVFTTLMAIDDNDKEKDRIKEQAGLWSCSLIYPVINQSATELTDDQKKAIEVFNKLESLCPRFFAPGKKLVSAHEAGYMRAYPNSDSSLILTFNGQVYVKNARALNPEKIALASEIFSTGYKIDCNKFRGRSGLPWEREI